jgi:hypothetical protein
VKAFIILLLGLVVGFSCSFINWGRSEALHGQGLPFPVVIWEAGRDYPNPLSYGFNALSGAILALAIWGVSAVVRRIIIRAKQASRGKP